MTIPTLRRHQGPPQWMNEQMDEWMGKWMNERMSEQSNEWKKEGRKEALSFSKVLSSSFGHSEDMTITVLSPACKLERKVDFLCCFFTVRKIKFLTSLSLLTTNSVPRELWDLARRRMGTREGPATVFVLIQPHTQEISWKPREQKRKAAPPLSNPPLRLGSSQKPVLIEFQIIGLASARVS